MPASSETIKLKPAPGVDARGFSFVLREQAGGLELQALHRPDYGAIRADWLAAELRRRIAGGRKQLLARAVGLHRKTGLSIHDVTGGLGRDGFTLAALGAQVTLVERWAPIAALLRDAQRRALAADEAALRLAAGRIVIVEADALSWLRDSPAADVICLDPMYPDDGKSALPQKEMQILRDLTGGDADADALLLAALSASARRVVVKRPLKAPPLAGREPTLQMRGTQARFDVYLKT